MRILIFGKNGQLGSKFTEYLEKNNINFLSISRNECNITDFSKVRNVVKDFNPDIVINCTAYNLVDKAEEDYLQAFDVNTFAVKNLAFVCNEFNKFLIHYSTDYVFDGTKQHFYTEDDLPNPLNIYAKSKLSGEILIKEILKNYLIFRVSWVYGKGKQNFLYKLQQWASANDTLKIAVDEFSVPTSTRTIVDMTMKAIKQGLTGLYHLTNSGYASRYEWAKEYFKIKGIKKLIYPAYQSDFNLPAKRPKWSVMSNEKISKDLGVDIPLWYEELKDLQP
ncbi:dTDP-4-dehydrorhamnose reductase [Sulfurihydrogenibium sp.]|uniref:dTDP-4-dehydrorhamnose reductase n=1 Tax=Sulfurihydrogenibium sp. TaxID=2053621 RepID=UPI00262F021A|nr:dTDP-4-dehydrorhamnose reductase [Sulfurihydrogenibium sp.]